MIAPIRTLKDNYVWTIINQQQTHAIIIDPGEALPVITYLKQHQLALEGIFLTHHHWDHVNGVKEIQMQYKVPVWGSVLSPCQQVTHYVTENDVIVLNDGSRVKVMEIPGHTHDHIAFQLHDALFCGDTLFGAGCGRLFEGSPEEMYHSLQKIARLPASTQIYCAHEYTLINLKFAQAVEPTNAKITQRIKEIKQCYENHQPSLPSTLAQELETNPFLRCDIASVKQQAEFYTKQLLPQPVDVFSALRQWKDHFI